MSTTTSVSCSMDKSNTGGQLELDAAFLEVIHKSCLLWSSDDKEADSRKMIGKQYVGRHKIPVDLNTPFTDSYLNKLRNPADSSAPINSIHWPLIDRDYVPFDVLQTKETKLPTSTINHRLCSCGKTECCDCKFPWNEFLNLRQKCQPVPISQSIPRKSIKTLTERRFNKYTWRSTKKYHRSKISNNNKNNTDLLVLLGELEKEIHLKMEQYEKFKWNRFNNTQGVAEDNNATDMNSGNFSNSTRGRPTIPSTCHYIDNLTTDSEYLIESGRAQIDQSRYSQNIRNLTILAGGQNLAKMLSSSDKSASVNSHYSNNGIKYNANNYI